MKKQNILNMSDDGIFEGDFKDILLGEKFHNLSVEKKLRVIRRLVERNIAELELTTSQLSDLDMDEDTLNYLMNAVIAERLRSAKTSGQGEERDFVSGIDDMLLAFKFLTFICRKKTSTESEIIARYGRGIDWLMFNLKLMESIGFDSLKHIKVINPSSKEKKLHGVKVSAGVKAQERTQTHQRIIFQAQTRHKTT